jgi:ribosomal protein L22
VAGS